MMRRALLAIAALLFAVTALAVPTLAQPTKPLRVVMHSDLKILDPV